MPLYYKYILAISINFLLGSCKKWIEIDAPKTQLSGSEVFTNNATATAAVLNIYIGMEESETYLIPSLTGLMGDEIQTFNTNVVNNEFFSNAISVTNTGVKGLWDKGFKYIYSANAVIEGLETSQEVSEPVKAVLMGEAKFIRAYWNFYLTNLFGGIPLITGTDYRINSIQARRDKSKIFEQVISDLKDAALLLPEHYLNANNISTVDKVRPNKWAANALLARCFLYMKNWEEAVKYATKVIDAGVYELNSLDQVFLKNSKEAIWQLMPVSTTSNTLEGNQFIPISTPTTGITALFFNGFENEDQRKIKWLDSIKFNANVFYYPSKYKIKTITPGTAYQEHSMVLRFAEQFLIRAESQAQLMQYEPATEDLNVIRTRAGLPPFETIVDQESLLKAIAAERRSELFTEWGHRWFDLNRTDKANELLSVIKTSWQQTDSILPIPEIEILNNPSLKQNIGY